MTEYSKTYETFDPSAFEIVNENRTHLMFNCPFCMAKRGRPDNDGKFYFSKEKLVGYCFKCSTVGYPDLDIDKDNTDVELKVAMNRFLGNIKSVAYDQIQPIEFDFPDLDEDGFNYLNTRNRYLSYLDKYLDLKLWKSDQYSGIVIPFYYEGSIVKFQVRFFSPNGNKRYHTSIGKKILYSPNRIFKKFRTCKEVSICEGVFDAIALLIMGYQNPLAILGSDITEFQTNLLRKLVPININLCMDEDSINEKIAHSLRVVPSVSNVKHCLFDGSGDPDEYLLNSKKDFSNCISLLIRSQSCM